MMGHTILRLIFAAALAVAVAGCGKSPEKPFKGYWYSVVPNADGDGGSRMHIRLDFYDNTVSVDGFDKVAGVMSITEDRSVYTPITADLIKEVKFVGDNKADIKYVQQSSGQLWSGSLTYDPLTRSMTFSNGEMLEPGPSRDTVPVELPYPSDPTLQALDFVSEKPNYKEIPSYYLVLELPDRIYYRNIIADETVAPPFGDMQLRCYYPETDRDVNITNEVGVSPLGSNYNATIIDCWPLEGEPGLMLITWTAGPRYQEFTLYRVDDSNRFIDVDYVIGRRPARAGVDEDNPEKSEIATMVRNGKQVRVYDPRDSETRVYDLAGHRL